MCIEDVPEMHHSVLGMIWLRLELHRAESTVDSGLKGGYSFLAAGLHFFFEAVGVDAET